MTDWREELAAERQAARRAWAVNYVVAMVSKDGPRVRASCEEAIRLGHVAAALDRTGGAGEPVAVVEFGRPHATGSDAQQRRGLVREKGRVRARAHKARLRLRREQRAAELAA